MFEIGDLVCLSDFVVRACKFKGYALFEEPERVVINLDSVGIVLKKIPSRGVMFETFQVHHGINVPNYDYEVMFSIKGEPRNAYVLASSLKKVG